MRLSSLLAAVLIATLACGSDNPTTPVTVETTTFAPALNVNLQGMIKTASGLFYKDSVVGSGSTAGLGSAVTVNYTGWLADGTKFDSSFDPGHAPYAFTIGPSATVIAGWNEGLVGMKVGGWRKLVIPPELGYGGAGNAPSIPGNAVLVFNVQLVTSK
jgi:FKBP-type peptidyl-prolyl cis-trans isomerase